MKKIACITFLLLVNRIIFSQVSLQWEHHYSYFGMQWGNGVRAIVDNTDIPVVLGMQWGWEQTPILHLYKLNPQTGSVLWDTSPPNSEGQYLFIDSSNNIYISGRIKDGFTWKNPFLAKYSPSGTQIFYTTETVQPYTELSSSWLDRSGNSYLLMRYQNKFKIVKYNSSGSIGWSAFYGDHDSLNYPTSIISENNGDVIVSGFASRNASGYITALRIDGNGVISDTAEFPLPTVYDASIRQMHIDSARNIYLMGHYISPGAIRKYIFLKIAPNFSLIWSKTDSAGSYPPPSKFRVQSDGTIIRRSANGILKYDQTGNVLWTFSSGSMNDIITGRDNYIYASGSSGNNYLTCKIDQSGASIWQISHQYPSYSSNIGLSIAIDTSRNLYVHGTSNAGIPSLIATLKYSQLSGINQVSEEIPNKSELLQNYPNPFNPSTSINFKLSKPSKAVLKIYDVSGKEIFSFNHKELIPGTYEYKWDASAYSSGIYFAKLITDNFSETRKMILIK